MKTEWFTRSVEETAAAAAHLGARLTGGETLLLEGPLGAGKTAFVQGLAKALGAETVATSPTFAILNTYPLQHPTFTTLVHLDLYRIKKEEELLELGLEEWLGREDVIVAIEWPSVAGKVEWPKAMSLTFAYADDGRKIILS